MTRERIEKAPNLKLAITAGVGSDHVDLAAASEHNIGVVEVTGSNTVQCGRTCGYGFINTS